MRIPHPYASRRALAAAAQPELRILQPERRVSWGAGADDVQGAGIFDCDQLLVVLSQSGVALEDERATVIRA